ncbi:MAG: sarcosine oxidase subunit gamma [Yoonia sp.]|uniref:sarcosine oxidase subunit gamma n=1 Tax=Yoonia sp. TaxID=2212373 RepID=UPI003EF46237
MSEVPIETLMSVAPFAGQHAAVATVLQDQTGAGLPAPNRRDGPVTWFGHGVWMVSDAVTLDGAAITDQSDAWAVVKVQGETAEDVLARLVPIDLRAVAFGENDVAKTMLGHMSVTITRIGADAFEIMVMRSMAGTLVHDLSVAQQGVALR